MKKNVVLAILWSFFYLFIYSAPLFQTFFVNKMHQNSFSWRKFCYLVNIHFFSLLFLFLMCPFSASNRRWSALAAGSNYLDPNSRGVIRETGRTIWLHDWHCLMIMGSNSTLLWSTNHTGLAWTAFNAKESWPEYWGAVHPGSSTPLAPQEIRRTVMAVTLHHLQHCH